MQRLEGWTPRRTSAARLSPNSEARQQSLTGLLALIEIGRPLLLQESSEVETIEIHHFDPGRHKITHKRLLRVVAGVDFRDGSELRV